MGYLHPDLDVEATQAINGMILAAVIASLRDPAEETRTRLSTAIRRVMYDGIAIRT